MFIVVNLFWIVRNCGPQIFGFLRLLEALETFKSFGRLVGLVSACFWYLSDIFSTITMTQLVVYEQETLVTEGSQAPTDNHLF